MQQLKNDLVLESDKSSLAQRLTTAESNFANYLPLTGGGLTGALTSTSTISSTGGFIGNLTGNVTGNSTTCDYPLGFSGKRDSAAWGAGNAIGDFITGWYGPGGSDISFRNNGGQMNICLDGYIYQREGGSRVLDTTDVSYSSWSVSITKTATSTVNSAAFSLPSGMWFLMGCLTFYASSAASKIQLKFNNLTYCPWNNDSQGGDNSKECMCFGFHNSSSATSVTCTCWTDFVPTTTTATISILGIKLRAY